MKIHLISHTHWDREWYKPFQYFNVKLHYLFESLFELFEREESFKHFMLDGQMLMIEDYLTTHPHQATKIKRYVEEGRLIIGPWYSQPDEFAPDAEALVRNLLYGINMAKQFGPYMKVGYLPDSFGHNAQIPQILKGFKIDNACVMRGVPVNNLKQTEFIWESLNGDKVLAVALPKGYSNGMFLPLQEEQIKIRIQQAIKDLKKYGNNKTFLIMNGVDHQFPQKQLLAFLSKEKNGNIEYYHSTLEDYIKDIKKDNHILTTIKGELITPVTNRVHTSIASSRMNQKKVNREVEQLLTHRVEPLLTYAWALGANYPKELVDQAWKLLLQNQAHDSIGGCCTDEVHHEMDQRFNDIKNLGTSLWKAHSRAIASLFSASSPKLFVFNDALVKGKQIVTADVYTIMKDFVLRANHQTVPYVVEKVEIIDVAEFSIWSLYLETPCPAYKTTITFELDFNFNYGYKEIDIYESEKQENNFYQTTENHVFENKYSLLTVYENGSFDLFDKATKKTYKKLNQFEDCGDAGDSYNYSPVLNDTLVTSKTIKNQRMKVKETFFKTEITINFEIDTPNRLVNNDKNRSKKTTAVKYETTIIMYPNYQRIDVITNIDNTVKDHRIRVLFPSDIVTSHSFAEVQFGVIKRPIKIDEFIWKKEKWAEKPLPIYAMQRFVGLSDNTNSLVVLNKGLTEYEIYEEDNTIALTLFRGFGMMGKADLLVRPGRPSGVCKSTPDAQMLGRVTSEYSVLIQNGELNTTEITREAVKYNANPLTVQNELPINNIYEKFGNLKELFNIERLQDKIALKMKDNNELKNEFITIDSKKLVISSIKKAENEAALILRLFNPTAQKALNSQITFGKTIKKVYLSNLLEERVKLLQSNKQSFTTAEVNKYSSVTYFIEI